MKQAQEGIVLALGQVQIINKLLFPRGLHVTVNARHLSLSRTECGEKFLPEIRWRFLWLPYPGVLRFPNLRISWNKIHQASVSGVFGRQMIQNLMMKWMSSRWQSVKLRHKLVHL